MFRSMKRLLAAATAVLAVSTPSVAYAFRPVPAGGSSTSGQAQLPIAPSAPQATSSTTFQWGDAGIGAAAALSLLGAGSGMLVIRRRVRHPLAN